MSASANAPVTFPITAPGGPQAAQAFNQVANATSKADAAYKKMAENSAKVASTMAALGGAARNVSPAIGTLGEAVGRASGAIGAMTGVLGGGVAGIAAGGLIALLGLYSDAAGKAAEATKKLTEEQEKQAKVAKEQWETAVKLANQVLNTDPAAGIQAQITAQTAQLQAFQKTHHGAISADERRMQAAIDKLKNLARQARELAKVDNDEANADAGGRIGPNIADDAGPGVGLLPGNSGRYRQNIEAIDAAQKELDRRKKILDSAAEGIKGLPGDRKVLEQALNDEFRLKNEKLHEGVEAEKQVALQRQRLDEEQMQRWASMRAQGISTYQGIGTVGIQALQRLAKGQKVTGKEIMATIGDFMVADGTRWMWQGIASLNPLQATLGLAEIAAGVGMGAAGSAGGHSPKADGGDRYSYWYGDKMVKNSPIAPAAKPNGGSMRPNVTVNVNALSGRDPAVGQEIARSIEESNRLGYS